MGVEQSRHLAEQILEIIPLVMRSVAADLRQASQLPDYSHFHLLWMLERAAYTLSELAEKRSVSLPTMSNSVTILEDHGWVRRTRATDDRRKVVIQLTDSGRAILNQVRQRSVERIAEILVQVSEGEQQQISAGLLVLQDAFLKVAPWPECPPVQTKHVEGEK